MILGKTWIVVAIIILSLILMNTSAIGGILLLLSSLVLFYYQPMIDFTKKIKIKIKIKNFDLFLIFSALLISWVAFFKGIDFIAEKSNEIKARQKAEIQREIIKAQEAKKLKYFQDNYDEILKKVRDAIKGEQYEIAIFHSEEFVSTNDPELIELFNKASLALKEKNTVKEKLKHQQEIKILVKSLESIPKTKVREIYDVYTKLNELEPDEKSHLLNKEEYERKIYILELQEAETLKAEQRKLQEITRVFGKEPVRSSWDGSYTEITEYFRLYANDPDSIQIQNCTNARATKSGWKVKCDYRGKNSFGALVRKSSMFTISNGVVIDVN